MSTKVEPSPALKILMLHGYTQDGSLFHSKTKAMDKLLVKTFPGTVLSYPTGPLRLNARDAPGFDPSSLEGSEVSDTFGWWRRSNTSEPPEYLGLEDGLSVIAEVLRTEGPFDGVIGFSQGACLAGMIASLLEGEPRRTAFTNAQKKSSLAISYPAPFADLHHPPLKFCVSYSGFVAPGERYEAFYKSPFIQTPVCHFIGSLDSVVEESRTQALVSACGGPSHSTVVTHPGGHFVPNQRQYLDTLIAFIKAQCSPSRSHPVEKDEKVEDMDVPF